jgi:hypothetical protein
LREGSSRTQRTWCDRCDALKRLQGGSSALRPDGLEGFGTPTHQGLIA